MSAFQKVYEEYAHPVYRFLLSLSCKEDLAEELLQETFFFAFQHTIRLLTAVQLVRLGTYSPQK